MIGEEKCEFCGNQCEDGPYINNDDVVYIERDCDWGICLDAIRIHYCPVCGRKLS